MDKEILSVVLILVLLLLFGVILYLNNSKKINSTLSKKILGDLLQVKKILDSKNPLVYRDSIVRLDLLLNKSLKLYYKNSETCGNNLKQARDLFEKKEYNKIWEVHKLRNNVVHENLEISYSQAKEAYNIISKAIKRILYG